MPLYTSEMSAREVWDLSLMRRIDQLETRAARHEGREMTERLEKLLAGIEERKAMYAARLCEYLTDEQKWVVDGMKPHGKVWARARSKIYS